MLTGVPIDDTCQRVNMATAENSVSDSPAQKSEMNDAQAEEKPLMNEEGAAQNGPIKDYRPRGKGLPKSPFEEGFYSVSDYFAPLWLSLR